VEGEEDSTGVEEEGEEEEKGGWVEKEESALMAISSRC
jgi:hypothetical protein